MLGFMRMTKHLAVLVVGAAVLPSWGCLCDADTAEVVTFAMIEPTWDAFVNERNSCDEVDDCAVLDFETCLSCRTAVTVGMEAEVEAEHDRLVQLTQGPFIDPNTCESISNICIAECLPLYSVQCTNNVCSVVWD